MKVALVHRHYPMIGGISTIIDYLKREMDIEDYEIITNKKGTTGKNVKYISGFALLFYIKLLFYLRGRFDIIHSHSFPLAMLSPIIKTKVILGVHGFEVRFDKYKQGKINKVRHFLNSYVRAISYYMADGIISVSYKIKDHLIKDYGIKENKIITIHNGVNTKRFRPLKPEKDNKIKIFLYGCGERKGFPLVVKLAEELTKKHKNLLFVVVGPLMDIPKEIKGYFQFMEYIKFKEMPRVYNQMDIIILPSLLEPFGLVAVEGMACGKPVIVSNYSGASEVIRDCYNGLICDIDQFKTNLSFLIEYPDTRQEMGVKARETALLNFNPKVMLGKHLEAYGHFINENRNTLDICKECKEKFVKIYKDKLCYECRRLKNGNKKTLL